MGVLKESYKGNDVDLRRIMAQYDDGMHAVEARKKEERESQRDALMSKLAARKRMKEELNREAAVAMELNKISESQVKISKHTRISLWQLAESLIESISDFEFVVL